MGPTEAFLLSLCSKRTFRCVKAVWKKYRCETGVDVDGNGNILYYVTTDVFNGQRYNILRLKEQNADGDKPDKVMKSSSSVEVPFDFDNKQFVCRVKKEDLPLHEIHNRLCELFRIEKDAVQINGNRMAASLMTGMVTKSRYTSDSHSAADLNAFFTSNPAHTLSIIDGLCPPEVIRPFHPVCYVENLMLSDTKPDMLFFLNFKGKHLIVKNAEFTKGGITYPFAFMIEKMKIPFESMIIILKNRIEVDWVLDQWREDNLFTSEKPPANIFEYNSE
ncbi:hypothetical protein CRE_08389 [Caenorhabditis remanei]|uniref:Uncharacterized protein n=1 Tax=Caenorhabditis remanei TaxID=31234 RepID=E3MPH3_CAERE|nr:hypothetical protein CRE_08389 [Caenorhabditis remanei]